MKGVFISKFSLCSGNENKQTSNGYDSKEDIILDLSNNIFLTFLLVVSLLVFPIVASSEPTDDLDDDGVPQGPIYYPISVGNVVTFISLSDNCPIDFNANQTDTDSDGKGNTCDVDDDGDGVADINDAFSLDANETVDTDGDGIGNNADIDDDGDGIPDVWENENGLDSLVADSHFDADNDGYSNLDEYLNYTDIYDANYYPPDPNSFATTAGATLGDFSVDASGSANYSIPIAVPPGTAGMQPSLNLSYNSRSGNGLLGVGWTLGGLSVITRCPTTKVIDGFIDGVDFNENDRFCIDGQRLIQVTGNTGDYGNDGIEYRTEIDGFTKVVSYDTDATNNGPEYFVAKTKSGQILEYGNTSDSRIEAEGKTDVRLWAVNKISDTVDNYMTVMYNENNSNGEYYPVQIDYTGNDFASIGTYSQVIFEYEDRVDDAPLYFAGSMVQNTQRLTNITTYYNSILVKDYQLSYENVGSVNRSRLTQIQECDISEDCFKPITFDWETNTGTYNTLSNWKTESVNYANWTQQLIDVNGDGLSDHVLMKPADKAVKVGLNNGSGFDSLVTWFGSYSLVGWTHHLEDVNGDGLPDNILRYINSAGNGYAVSAGLNNGTGFDDLVSWKYELGVNYTSWTQQLIDVNGDGLPDHVLMKPADKAVKVGLNNGSGFDSVVNWSDGYSLAGWTHELEDVNGDGLPDNILRYINSAGNGYAVSVGLNNGTGFDELSSWRYELGVNYTSWTQQLIDVNGDGLSDHVLMNTSNQDIKVGLNNGAGFDLVSTWMSGSSHGGWTQELVDVNGDGLLDCIIRYINSAGNGYAIKVGLNNGSGFDALSTWQSELGVNYVGWTQELIDINGDGLSDHVIRRANSSGYHLHIGENVRKIPNQLHNIFNSLNTSTSISYTPITDSNVYTKGTSAVYPEVDIQGPVYVVSSVKVDDGIGGQRETTYTYSEAKSRLDGRGFLGFKTMSSMDVSTGIKTTTTYSQNHPYIGLVERTEQRLSDNQLLGEVDTTFAHNKTHEGVEVDVSHDGVLFPYAATVTKKDYEIE